MIYSEDRERRLRLVLGAVVAFGVLLALLGLYAALGSGGEYTRFGTALVIAAALVLTSGVVALRSLPSRGRNAKTATVVTGVLVLVVGMGLAPNFLGVVVIVLAIAVLLLALLKDDPDLLDGA